MIVLRSPELLVRVDPRHGGEILDLVHLATGRQLLGRPPFASEPPRPGDLEEPVWTASYRGGWQLAAPNAGNVCEVDGVRHGFHGRASNDPWTVSEASGEAATLAWEGHGLRIERRLELAGDTLVVTTRFLAQAAAVPAVAVEHLSVGLELLEPEVEIRLPRRNGLRAERAGRAADRSRTVRRPGRRCFCSTAPASARTAGVCRSHGAATWSSATSRQGRLR